MSMTWTDGPPAAQRVAYERQLVAAIDALHEQGYTADQVAELARKTYEARYGQQLELLDLPSDPAEQFDLFWRQYPRKVGKADAFKAWRQMGPAERAASIDRIASHVVVWAAEGRSTAVIPYPATWLRGRSWEDEVEYQEAAPPEGRRLVSKMRRSSAQRLMQRVRGDDNAG